MKLEAYLNRIGVRERMRPDLASLRALHRAHLFAIPYENLDVQLGRRVGLGHAPIFEKIVTGHRGGWCYEMNTLFGWALQEIGFRVTRMAGAVMRQTRGPTAIGNHLVLQVELPEGAFLADVGFGDGPLDPVPIAAGEFHAHGFAYRLSRPEEDWWRLHKLAGGGGVESFDFTIGPADESLLAERCAWLQSSPESPFVQTLICQRRNAAGLVILRGRVLQEVTPDAIIERLIESADEHQAALKNLFALDVPEAGTLWPAICAAHDRFMAEQDGR